MFSPFLYFGVPELRHLGRDVWQLYFLPAQTIFYFVIPNAEESRGWKTLRSIFWAVQGFKQQSSSEIDQDNEISHQKCWPYQRRKTLERVGNENKIATFEENTLEDLKVDEELRKKNKLSVTFVENIFGMFNNWLTQNPNPDRLILALSSNVLSTVIHFWSKLTQVDLGKRAGKMCPGKPFRRCLPLQRRYHPRSQAGEEQEVLDHCRPVN